MWLEWNNDYRYWDIVWGGILLLLTWLYVWNRESGGCKGPVQNQTHSLCIQGTCATKWASLTPPITLAYKNLHLTWVADYFPSAVDYQLTR